jgi:hypothetical protein
MKPRQVKAWLSALPAEALPRGLAILQFATACNRADLPDDRRGQLLEVLEPVLLDAQSALQSQYRDAPLPMDATSQARADLAAALLTELAEAYRLLVQAHQAPGFRLFGPGPLPGLLRGRLGHLSRLLRHHYEIHAALPEGLWRDLHQTYALAVKLGHAASAASEGGPSATDLYRAALLLAIADPYRMPRHELAWALDLIQQQGDLVQLVPATAARLRPGCFVVEAKADEPPFPLARDHDPLHHAWSLSVNVTQMVKFLTWLGNRLDDPTRRFDPEIEARLRDPRYPVFLHRLKRQWSAAQQRLSKRRPAARPVTYQVCAGFASLVASLSARDPGQFAVVNCRATNFSAGGMTLVKAEGPSLPLQVGILLGVRENPKAPWQVGVVRWLRSPQQGELAFGVQLLAPCCQVATLLAHDRTAISPALLLSAQVGRPESGILVSPPALLPSGPMARILVRGQSLDIKLEQRLQLATDLDTCRIRVIG